MSMDKKSRFVTITIKLIGIIDFAIFSLCSWYFLGELLIRLNTRLSNNMSDIVELVLKVIFYIPFAVYEKVVSYIGFNFFNLLVFKLDANSNAILVALFLLTFLNMVIMINIVKFTVITTFTSITKRAALVMFVAVLPIIFMFTVYPLLWSSYLDNESKLEFNYPRFSKISEKYYPDESYKKVEVEVSNLGYTAFSIMKISDFLTQELGHKIGKEYDNYSAIEIYKILDKKYSQLAISSGSRHFYPDLDQRISFEENLLLKKGFIKINIGSSGIKMDEDNYWYAKNGWFVSVNIGYSAVYTPSNDEFIKGSKYLFLRNEKKRISQRIVNTLFIKDK